VNKSITGHGASGVLAVVWQDHTSDRLPYTLLRSSCRCGACEQLRRRGDRALEVAPDIRLADIRPVGDKGLNLVFSDGHGRGIYPWAWLRELAGAQRCDARKAAVSPAIAQGAAITHA
jgi:DUF971 family protein